MYKHARLDVSSLGDKYDTNCNLIKEFIQNYPKTFQEKKYLPQLQRIADRTQTTLEIHLDDIIDYFGTPTLVHDIEKNTMRYLHLFCTAIDDCLPRPNRPIDYNDVEDVYKSHRDSKKMAMSSKDTGVVFNETEMTGNTITPEKPTCPPELTRRYDLRFVPRDEVSVNPIELRKVRSQHIGSIVTVKGIVTRVTEEIRIQELPEQVPIGHIPRSMSVHLCGELTRRLSPGDIATIHGVFLPIPNQGFRVKFVGLVASTYIYAIGVNQHKRKYSDFIPDEKTAEILQQFISERSQDTYTRLALSIAPEIYGHEDIKKALLLMMVGGVTRVMADGMKIRGDINICLMGDPGVAKSQLLKHISTIAPRGVYTSGKGSTGVGLTAAVIKDPVTKELVLEGGSLVLADMGICCIDEFDKMEDADRTAIHEVMEQQTISIAKAGITTTLNARTSILAAANPLYGRYNLYKTPTENINLPAALLSRFDLLFILLDHPDPGRDRALAEHVTHVHRFKSHPALEYETLSPDLMRAYISLAKKVEPYVPPSLCNYIVDTYVSMRQKDYGVASDEALSSSFGYTTARTLLGILRLSQAMARVRFSQEVMQADVEEAIRLMQACHISLRHQKQLSRDKQERTSNDPVTTIYHIIRDYAQKSKTDEIRYTAVLQQVLTKYTQADLDRTLTEYERLGIWTVDTDHTKITFIQH